MLREHWLLILIIGGFTAIRLVVAPLFGLGVDEAHYILYARHIDWSYLDHPPLVGWLHFLFYRLFGTGEFLARLPAILLFALDSLLVYNFTIRISHSRQTALWATLAVNSSFLLNAL
ncbi:MAG: glycosyltransferase family 39 protein, partial [Smithellaceae bacterium]|nr:glycosyltransferase family 39 protein [Smithellaceae bacterium]